MPALLIDQFVPAAPSIASAPLAVACTLPAAVIVTGLFFAAKVKGPVVAVLIVRPPPLLTLTTKESATDGAELWPFGPDWVAVTAYVLLVRGEVGVTVQTPPATVAAPFAIPLK